MQLHLLHVMSHNWCTSCNNPVHCSSLFTDFLILICQIHPLSEDSLYVSSSAVILETEEGRTIPPKALHMTAMESYFTNEFHIITLGQHAKVHMGRIKKGDSNNAFRNFYCKINDIAQSGLHGKALYKNSISFSFLIYGNFLREQ